MILLIFLQIVPKYSLEFLENFEYYHNGKKNLDKSRRIMKNYQTFQNIS